MPIKDWFKKNKLSNNSIYSLGEELAENFLVKNLQNFSKHVDEQTLKVIWLQMEEMITSIASQEDSLAQISSLRRHISETTNIRAEHEILLLNKNNNSNNWINEEGISGELYEHLKQICITNRLLGESFEENNSSEQVSSLVSLGMYTASWYNEVLNGLRTPLKDYEVTNDWYNSFLCSRLIVQEDSYRKSININPLIKERKIIDAYSSFNKYVLDCHSDPFHAWKLEYSELISSGHISLPK